MPVTMFSPGRYKVRIENQRFLESPRKGTLGFCLSFRPQNNLDEPNARVQTILREATMWITEATYPRVIQDLRAIGYDGNDLSRLDPASLDFYDFCGREIELTCTHEASDQGGTFERWSFRKPSGLSSLPGLAGSALTSKLRRFEEMLSEDPNGAAEITDEDVPL